MSHDPTREINDPTKKWTSEQRASLQRLIELKSLVAHYQRVQSDSYKRLHFGELDARIIELITRRNEIQAEIDAAPQLQAKFQAEFEKERDKFQALREQPKVRKAAKLASQLARLKAQLEAEGVNIQDLLNQ